MASRVTARLALLALVAALAAPTAHAAHRDAAVGVDALVFSSDGLTLAVGSSDGAVRFWDLPTGRQVDATLAGGGGAALPIAFSRDGHTLFGSIGDGVSAWDVEAGKEQGAAFAHGEAAISFDRRTLAVADPTAGGTIALWNTTTHGRTATLEQSGGPWRALALSGDGKTVAAAGSRGLVIWDARTHRRIGEPVDAGGHVVGIAFSPDGRTIALSDARGVRLWSIAKQTYAIPVLGPGKNAALTKGTSIVVFSPDGGELVTVGTQGIFFWDPRNGKQVAPELTKAGPGSEITAFAFGPNGLNFATGTRDGHASIWTRIGHVLIGGPFAAKPGP